MASFNRTLKMWGGGRGALDTYSSRSLRMGAKQEGLGVDVDIVPLLTNARLENYM